jgi:hypothetical protein
MPRVRNHQSSRFRQPALIHSREHSLPAGGYFRRDGLAQRSL